MLPGMGDVNKSLTDAYEKAKAYIERHHKIDPEQPEGSG